MLTLCTSCDTQYEVGAARPGDHVRCPCGAVMEVPAPVETHARTLHCTSCGAAVSQGEDSCAYCEAEIALEARRIGDPCPSCFVPVVMERDFCPGCGKQIDPIHLEDEPSDLSCARCKAPMRYRPQAGGGSFHECPRCDGLWLSVRSFRVVIDTKEQAVPLVPEVPSVEKVRAGVVPEPIPDVLLQTEVRERAEVDLNAYAPCPVCTKLMLRQNFARCSGVIIDWCKAHGYWFDGGELEQIVDFLVEGGLDKARDRDERRRRIREQIARVAGGEPDRDLVKPLVGAAGYGERKRRDDGNRPPPAAFGNTLSRKAMGTSSVTAPEAPDGFFRTLGGMLGALFDE